MHSRNHQSFLTSSPTKQGNAHLKSTQLPEPTYTNSSSHQQSKHGLSKSNSSSSSSINSNNNMTSGSNTNSIPSSSKENNDTENLQTSEQLLDEESSQEQLPPPPVLTSSIPVSINKPFKVSKKKKIKTGHTGGSHLYEGSNNSSSNNTNSISSISAINAFRQQSTPSSSSFSTNTVGPHMESRIPKYSIRPVPGTRISRPGSTDNLSSVDPKDSDSNTETISNTNIASASTTMSFTNTNPSLSSNSLKRSFQASQTSSSSSTSSIPKPNVGTTGTGTSIPSSLRSKSIANLRNGSFSSRSHIPPSGTLHGTGTSNGNTNLMAPSFPFRGNSKSSSSSSLGHRSSTFHATGSGASGPKISQYSEDLMSYQQNMLHRQSEEIQELKTTLKKFELEKQKHVDRCDDLRKQVGSLESQVNTAALDRVKLESAYKEQVNQVREEQREQVMKLKDQIHAAVLAKEQELSKEMQRRANEYEEKLEAKVRDTAVSYKQEIGELRKMQAKAVEDREKQLTLELENVFGLKQKEIENQHKWELEEEKRNFEDQQSELKREYKMRTESDAARISELETQVNESRQQVERLQQDSVALEKLLLQKTNELMHSTKECAEITGELDKTRSELISSQKDVIEYKQIIDSNNNSLQDRQKQLQDDLSSARHRILELETETHTCNQKLTEARVNLVKEEALRRKLHNKIQDMKGNLRVYCRVRPLLPHEQLTIPPSESQKSDQDNNNNTLVASKNSLIDLDFPDRDTDGQQLCLTTHKLSARSIPITDAHSFEFDKVFGPTDTTQRVFDEVSELVQSALDGYNVCIFAYGQTGSGKTFTMMQPGEGIVIKAIDQIFEAKKSMREIGWKYEMSGEALEIYNEKIFDLVGGNNGFTANGSSGEAQKLTIRHQQDTRTTIVEGLTQVPLESPLQTRNLLSRATQARSTAATCANEHSSRSHSIFVIRLHGRHVGNPDLGIAATNECREGVLNLVDLAGSERLSHSKAQDGRLKETQAINKSLSSLVDVISAMAARNGGSMNNSSGGGGFAPGSFGNGSSSNMGNGNKIGGIPTTPGRGSSMTTPSNNFSNFNINNNGSNSNNNTITGSFIPFRNSKLTHLLQYSLSGNAKTLMLVNVSPCKDHEQETLRSLRFASMANHTRIR